MEQHQIATLVLMQIFVLPAAYCVWVIGKATWGAIASDRADARSVRADREDPFRDHYSFMLVWLMLNAVLLALVDAL